MSKKPIKSSLFRFVTLRSPQAIDDKENKAGFVVADSSVKTASAYYQAVSGVAEGDNTARATALENADSDPSFVLIDNKASLKTLSPDLYNFSSWLMRNKNYLSYASIASNLPAGFIEGTLTGVILTSQERTQIWDNLIYQTVNRSSTPVREALIQMLITDQFVQEFKAYHDSMTGGEGEIVFTDQDENEFRRRANASLVIEKEVLLSNNLNNVEVLDTMSESMTKMMESELNIKLAKKRIDEYKTALDELQRESTRFQNKTKTAYSAALDTHKSNLSAELDLKKTTDSGTQKVSYPGVILPDFSYEEPTINFQDFSGNIYSDSTFNTDTLLSQDTLDVLQREDFDTLVDFDTVCDTIKDLIEQEEEVISDNDGVGPQLVTFNGSHYVIDPLTTAAGQPYCFTGNLERKVVPNGLTVNITYALNIYIATYRDYPYPTSVTYNLTRDSDSTVYTGPGGSLISNEDQKLLYRMPLTVSAQDITKEPHTVNCTITFNNGDIVDFTASVQPIIGQVIDRTLSLYPYRGCGVLQNGQPADDPVVAVPTFNGVINLGIADFRRVEQEVCCYVPGEVSHIENIMARQYKEKSTRSLVSSEVTSEQTSEREFEQLTDTTSTERNELQAETSAVVDQQNSSNFGASASVNGEFNNGKIKFGTNTSFGSSSSTATSNSTSQAENYAQEVTERALERVVEKVSSKRTSRVLREYEENNTHGFDNRKGDQHVTGVYRWVDIIYENQIVNYGKRLMFEFSVPEPSKYFKHVMLSSVNTDEVVDGRIYPTLPVHPSNLPLNIRTEGAHQITRANYQKIAAQYNAEVEPAPLASTKVSESFSLELFDSSATLRWKAGDGSISIPEGYQADSATASATFVFHPDKEEFAFYSVHVGDKNHYKSGKLINSPNISFSGLGGIRDQLAISYSAGDLGSFSVTVVASCSLTTEAFAKWQNETYNAIMNAYYARVNEYNEFDSTDISTPEEAPVMRFNPKLNRATERRELKRAAIELLTKGTNIQVAQSHYTVPQDEFAINANDNFDKHTEIVKFFEQAFDWEIMAYSFYPYFYANKAEWEELLSQTDDTDPIFKAFLQSGMARMVVPVREGFEKAVNWYQATGEIWYGEGLVTDLDDELYVSIVDEMLEPVGQAEGLPWKTQVPTSLTIVQDGSAKLIETGLPCNPDCGETSPIEGSTWVISGDGNSNASDGVGADVVGTDNNVA